MLKASHNDYDWLGPGMYFWEGSLYRALSFARELKRRPRAGRPAIKKPAVLGAVIELGNCLDLTDMQCLMLLKYSYNALSDLYNALGESLPENKKLPGSKDVLLRKLDCAVIEYLHKKIKQVGIRPFDSVRGIFAEGKPIYPNAGFCEKDHVQLCILNPNCIKGFFVPRVSDDRYAVP